MPLKPGCSNEVKSANIAELMHAYEQKGRIGNTTPRNKAHALRIAKAIAMATARESCRKGKL